MAGMPITHRPGLQMPLFDAQSSLERLGGDADLFRNLILFFEEDCPPLLEKIGKSIENRNTAELERAAHSLKGLAANFSAKRAVAAAAEMEELGREGDLERAGQQLPQLCQQMGELIDALHAYREGSSS